MSTIVEIRKKCALFEVWKPYLSRISVLQEIALFKSCEIFPALLQVSRKLITFVREGLSVEKVQKKKRLDDH